MEAKKKKGQRKEEILEAVLGLLGEMPLSDLSTRKIARRLGVTQPALFRHFRSKEALLVAVVGRAREQMGRRLEGLLKEGGEPEERLLGLLELVLGMARERPGLPRLLFHDSGEDREGPLGRALATLVSMQENLAALLCKELGLGGAERSREAARRLVALVQGTVLQGFLRGVSLEPREEARGILELFLHGARGMGGARGGERGGERGGATQVSEEAEGVGLEGSSLGVLDVRPLLAAGEDPLERILLALERLPKKGVLVLRAPFRPRPLLVLLEEKGYRLRVEQRGDGLFEVLIQGSEAPEIEDLRGLPAPEPLERILFLCSKLEHGQTLAFRTPRVPRLLLQRLEEKGLCAQFQSLGDDTALIMIRS